MMPYSYPNMYYPQSAQYDYDPYTLMPDAFDPYRQPPHTRELERRLTALERKVEQQDREITRLQRENTRQDREFERLNKEIERINREIRRLQR